MQYLRVEILKPGAGWGVSLWQVDLYGTEGASVNERMGKGTGEGEGEGKPLDSSDLKVLADDWDAEGHAPRVKCSTTKGDILIQIRPKWAPLGAERFLALVRDVDFFSANGGVGLFR